MVRDCAARYGDRTAILYDIHNEQFKASYEQAAEAVEAKTEKFRSRDFECLGICESPSPSWILNVFSAAMAGKRVVLLNYQQKTEYVRENLEKCGVDFVLCNGRKDADILRQAADHNRMLHQQQKAAGRDETIEDGGKILIFTSGTTEGSHAVVLSQKALLTSAEQGGTMLRCGPGDLVLGLLPLSHAYGFVAGLLWPLLYGATVAVSRGFHNLRTDTMYYRPTLIVTVPSILQYLLSVGGLNPELRAMVIGAAPSEDKVLQAASAKGIDVRFGYGMTETASGVAMNLAGDSPHAMTLCPGVEARVDEDKLLYLRTPCMMEGYYHDQEATDEVLWNGELNTGDLAEIDENGKIHVLGRQRDMLILPNGYKIFCPEWERKLGQMLKTQVALVLRHDRLVLVAVGSEHYRKECEQQIREFNETCPHGLEIRRLIMRDEPFPRTASGKIIRRLL